MQWNITQSYKKQETLPFETAWMDLKDTDAEGKKADREEQILRDPTSRRNLK